MNFKLNKEGNSIVYIYHDYSIEGYSLYYPINQKENSIVLNNLTFNIIDHYKGNINLMENEYYYLFIQKNEKNSNINIIIEYKDKEPSNKDKEKNEDGDGLQTWHIILIVLGSLLIVVLIIVFIILCIRKNKVTNKTIEEKMENLTELQ